MNIGAIFDMDGVLVDSGEAHRAAWQQIGEEHGVPFGPDVFERTFGMHNNQIIPLWLGQEVDRREVDRLAGRKEVIYRELAPRLTVALPGCIELVQALRDAGFRLAVGSSGPLQNIELILEQLQLRSHFDAISSGEDVVHGKPDPQVFLVAAQRLGLPPAGCVVVEDAPQGVEAARRAGMAVVAVTSSRPRHALRDASLVVDALSELSPARLQQLLA